MIAKSVLLAALIAYAEARFGQEQVPIQAISAVQGGDAGEAATIAGAAISDLLGAANACAKLTRADQIVTELGGGADAIAAAIGMVTAEKNTNPFANGNAQKVCADPTLPATAELRGITPLIDPDVAGAADVNDLSAQTAAAPLDADGLSVFDLIVNAGFGDAVVAEDAAGGAAAGGNANAGENANQNANQGNANANQGNDNGNANQGNDNANADQGNDNANQNANAGNATNACGGGAAGNATAGAGNNANQGNDNANANAGNDNAGNAAAGGAAQQSSIAGLDFGTCIPTMIFEGGLGGRPDTEFTFQLADPVAAQGQQEALNPNIITNRICDQLTNVCDANDAAKAACLDAKAQVQAAGTRDKTTADLFNSALGFEGFVTNPSGGPADPSELKRRALKFRA